MEQIIDENDPQVKLWDERIKKIVLQILKEQSDG